MAAGAAACYPSVSSPLEYGPKEISAKAGEAYFLETGGGDPYATGMAYPVFLALMAAYPSELGADWSAMADKFGLIPRPGSDRDPSLPPIGFHLTTDPNTQVPWLVANCQFCHAERLRLPGGDQIVAGMGSKRVRPHAYVDALARIGARADLNDDRILRLATERARALKIPWNETVAGPIVNVTLDYLRKGSRARRSAYDRFADGLPGRAATIEAFIAALNAANVGGSQVPFPEVIGWAKIPDVVGFPVRDTFSYDASGVGSPQALVLEADFVFGARPEWYASHLYIATSMYMYLRSFERNLSFPGAIDEARAERGHAVFEQACAHCHGSYVHVNRGVTRAAYREQVVPIDRVGTDRARLDAVTPEFLRAGNSYPLTQGLTRVRNSGGYVPPVLLDVWARAPLGHAGQWPSLEVLAMDPAERPRRFVVDTDATYDLDHLGIKWTNGETIPAPLGHGQYFYDGTKPGFGVQGHPFLSTLPPDDKRAVLEYLKTI